MSEFVRLLSEYDYAELRIERGNSTKLIFKDDEIKPSSGPFSGISARVLKDGSWGFAYSSNQQPLQLIKTAARFAHLSKGSIKVHELKPEKKTVKKKVQNISLEEKLDSLKEAKKHADSKHIKNRTLNYMENFITNEFYNSEGSEVIQEQFHSYFSCLCISQKNGIIQQGHERDSSTNSFNKLKLDQTCSKAAEKAERMLDAKLPPKGRFTAILDNEMTGVFSHEALGHACEGDSITERESILHGKLGKKIGNKLVNITDNPCAQGFGHYTYDDEGVKAQSVELIQRGVLKNYLNSRETAHELKHLPNGHARAMGYDHVPIVRMSNTHFLPGKTKKQELFDLSYAIYVKGMKGGSVDIFSGGFMFKAEEAYEIKDGSKEQLLRDVTLTGNILETLHNVDVVANDFAINPGFCGKMGQNVPVSDGGPHIRVKNMTLG